MSRLKETFTNPHVILPVVHVETVEQATYNCELAEQSGADGVFLIDMNGTGYRRLLSIYDSVQSKLPEFWIGLNCLDLTAVEAFERLPSTVSGIWTDNASIIENRVTQPIAEIISHARQASRWQGLYFGGVAFKYQIPVFDLEQVSRSAMAYTDVITTSGQGTGQAADLLKISRIRSAIGDYPLAIASGITPENITNYLNTTNCFLVATSLLVPETNDFDLTKVTRLIDAVRKWDRAQ